MELLAPLAMTAKEIFAYNREIYSFDQEQRLDREKLRIEMQIKRFDLFREDIRDLVELTTGKMEMYHGVGEILLTACLLWYTEGKVRAPSPPFIIAIYWLSVANAFVFFTMSVMLSVHASIAAHSFGTRLLTRFVRLPIPGAQQVNALNARLTDFEKQGLTGMMRMPFVGGDVAWQQRRAANGQAAKDEGHKGEGDVRFKPAVRLDNELRPQDLLGSGERAIMDDVDIGQAVRLPGHHVKLFRRLQAKWQCYDAYARVSMSLGGTNLLNATCAYLIILVSIEYESPTTCLAVITILQAAAVALSFLDIRELTRCSLLLIQATSSAAIYIAACAVILAEREEGELHQGKGEEGPLRPNQIYNMSPIPFFLIAMWLELLLYLASPSKDSMSLPKKYRTVLFLDVFAVADEAMRPQSRFRRRRTEQPQIDNRGEPIRKQSDSRAPSVIAEQAANADDMIASAEAALRRWQALPKGTAESRMRELEVANYAKRVLVARRMLNGEAARQATLIGDRETLELLNPDTRSWAELTAQEQEEDPYAGSLLGPLTTTAEGAPYYYDVETRDFVRMQDGRDVLTLDEVAELVQQSEIEVRRALGGDDDPEQEDDPAGGEAPDGDGDYDDHGEGPKRYVQQRLPWQVLCWLTRVMEVAWVFLGIMVLMEETSWKLFTIDHDVSNDEGKSHGQGTAGIARRLLETQWGFEALDMGEWPQGAFQWSDALHCIPDSTGGLLVGSSTGGWGRTSWQPLEASEPQAALLPPSHDSTRAGAATLCRIPEPGTPRQCLVAQPVDGGVAFWPLGHPDERTVLELEGQRLQMLTGSVLHCAQVADLLMDGVTGPGGWCLLLAGWDGRRLPVAAVRLPAVANVALPTSASAGAIVPVFDAAARWTDGAVPKVVALHLGAQGSRLWAVLEGGELQSWELLQGKELGRWMPALQRPNQDGAFLAAGICEAPSSGGLLVLGRHAEAGPGLFRAAVPYALAAQDA